MIDLGLTKVAEGMFLTIAILLFTLQREICPEITSCNTQILTDRKSTRLNSSHQITSYAAFCFKKKTQPGGFSPRVAARLRVADSRPCFLKATFLHTQPGSPAKHPPEGRMYAAHPPALRTPRLR